MSVAFYWRVRNKGGVGEVANYGECGCQKWYVHPCTVSRPLIGHQGADTGLWLVEAVCHRTQNCGNILNDQFHTPEHILPCPRCLWLISKQFPSICHLWAGGGLLNILADLNIFRQSTCCLVRDEGDNGADNEQGVHNPKSFYFCHRGDWISFSVSLSLLFPSFHIGSHTTHWTFSRQIFWDISPKNNYQLSDIFHILDIKYCPSPGSD